MKNDTDETWDADKYPLDCGLAQDEYPAQRGMLILIGLFE
jgi:hypothetical protein